MTVRRKLGEATTVHERNLEGAVARVPQWRGKDISYASLVGGLMNQNWLVEAACAPVGRLKETEPTNRSRLIV